MDPSRKVAPQLISDFHVERRRRDQTALRACAFWFSPALFRWRNPCGVVDFQIPPHRRTGRRRARHDRRGPGRGRRRRRRRHRAHGPGRRSVGSTPAGLAGASGGHHRRDLPRRPLRRGPPRARADRARATRGRHGHRRAGRRHRGRGLQSRGPGRGAGSSGSVEGVRRRVGCADARVQRLERPRPGRAPSHPRRRLRALSTQPRPRLRRR